MVTWLVLIVLGGAWIALAVRAGQIAIGSRTRSAPTTAGIGCCMLVFGRWPKVLLGAALVFIIAAPRALPEPVVRTVVLGGIVVSWAVAIAASTRRWRTQSGRR